MENKKLEIVGTYRGVNEENTEVHEFVISNESVDRHGTVFLADGWDLANYRKNPIVAYNHNRGGDNPDTIIGTSEVRIENGQLVASVTFESSESNPLAGKIRSKVEAGILRSASIGAIPIEGHWGEESRSENPDVLYFTRQELLEWSVVDVPSNTDAVKRDFSEVVKGFEKPKEEVIKKGLSFCEAQLLINKNK